MFSEEFWFDEETLGIAESAVLFGKSELFLNVPNFACFIDRLSLFRALVDLALVVVF